MQTLNVALGDRAYPIHIGRGLLARAELILPHLKTKRVAIVTNDVVGPLYLGRLRATLEAEGEGVVGGGVPGGGRRSAPGPTWSWVRGLVGPASSSSRETP